MRVFPAMAVTVAAVTMGVILPLTLGVTSEAAEPAAPAAEAERQAGAGGEAEAEEAEAEAEADDPLDGLDVKVSVQNIQYTSSMQFQPEGGEAIESHRANLNLRIEHDRATPLQVVGVEVEGRTNLGEAVTLTAPQFAHGHHHMHHMAHHAGAGGRTSRTVSINFEHPDALARTMTVEGHVVVRHPQVGHEAVIQPAGELEGKRLRIEGVETPLTIRFEREAQQLKLIYDVFEGRDYIAGVRVYDGDERPMQVNSSGRSQSNTRVEQRFRVDVPDDGTIVLDLISSIEELRLPVKLENLPLPRATPEGEPEFSIRARPREAEAAEEGEARARPREAEVAPVGGPIVVRQAPRVAQPHIRRVPPPAPAADHDAEAAPFDIAVEAHPRARRLAPRNVVIDD